MSAPDAARLCDTILEDLVLARGLVLAADILSNELGRDASEARACALAGALRVLNSAIEEVQS